MRGTFWRASPAGRSAAIRSEAGAAAISRGVTANFLERSRTTRSVTRSVLFWLTMIETRTSNGSRPSAQFSTRSRRQRMSNAFRKAASRTPSPLHERADHREDVPRPLAEAAHEVREPVRAVRNVLRDRVPLLRELPF